MSTTLLSSVLSLLAVATVEFLIVFTIFKHQPKDHKNISFANCWIGIGLVHFLMAIRTLFFVLGFPEFDRALAYVVQVFLVFALLAFGHYIAVISIIKTKTKYIFYFIVISNILLFLVFFLSFGLSEVQVSAWGTEYSPSWHANAVVGILVLIATAFLIRYLIINIKKRNVKESIVVISMLFFFAFNLIEQSGNIGWYVLMTRIFILIPVLTIYTVYELDRYKIQ